MKSEIVAIERWDTEVPQRDDTLCSAHGRKTCTRDLAADVRLKDAGSDRIHWTVCRHWLEHEPDVVAFETR
jgi:hypothetical protein